MRILLINQYFYPDMAATAQLLADLAEDLTAAGWTVTALAGKGSYAAAAHGNLPSQENWNEIQIRRVWCTNLGRRNSWGRMADYLTYLISAALVVLFSKRQDVVVCLSTPTLVAVLGLLAKLQGSRFVYKVEDLYPDIAVALGKMRKGSLLTACLSRLSRYVLSRADTAVALDQVMADQLLSRGARQVEVVPNWADGEAIRPDSKARNSFRKANQLDEHLVVLYSGNLGLAHRFDAVVQAARQIAARQPSILFLFVGAGSRLGEVKQSSAGLPNIRFMDYQPREKLNELYNAADIHLVSLRDETAGLQVPSKYSAALAAGKPVLLVGGKGSYLHQEIVNEHVGWTCRHTPDEIVDAVMEAFQKTQQTSARGAAARKLFTARYSRTISTGRWVELLGALLQKEKSPRLSHA